MKTLDQMTPDELRALANQKEKEDSNKIVKVGYLKEDLYHFIKTGLLDVLNRTDWFLSKNKVEKIFLEIKSHFEIILKAGSKFDCYLEEGEESWYDSSNAGVECMSAKWATKYLENIECL